MSDFAVTLEVAIMETIEKMLEEQSQSGVSRSPEHIKDDILKALDGVREITVQGELCMIDEDLCDE